MWTTNLAWTTGPPLGSSASVAPHIGRKGSFSSYAKGRKVMISFCFGPMVCEHIRAIEHPRHFIVRSHLHRNLLLQPQLAYRQMLDTPAPLALDHAVVRRPIPPDPDKTCLAKFLREMSNPEPFLTRLTAAFNSASALESAINC